MLTRHLRIDFTPCDFKAPRWFSAWARNDAGAITGIFAIEFPFWFEGKVTILVLDPRCMSRRVLRAIFTAAFRPSEKTDCRSRAGQSPGAAAGAAARDFVTKAITRSGSKVSAIPSSTACCGRIAAISPITRPTSLRAGCRCFQATSMRGRTDGQPTLTAQPVSDRRGAEPAERVGQPVQHHLRQRQRVQSLRLGQLRPGHPEPDLRRQRQCLRLRAEIHPDHHA